MVRVSGLLVVEDTGLEIVFVETGYVRQGLELLTVFDLTKECLVRKALNKELAYRHVDFLSGVFLFQVEE